MNIKNIISSTTFIIMCVLIVLIDLVYPVTFTYDSGHYMSYLDVLTHKAPWSSWDPVRGLVFPYYLKISLDLFGVNQNALLIPAILLHLSLFMLSACLVIEETKIENHKLIKIILIGVFIFIAVDPLILGYYHTILTEFIASSIALVSCVVGYILTKEINFPIKVSNKILLIVAYFCLVVPLAWHLKQPYVGAALFPLFISSVLIILRIPRKSVILHIIGLNMLVLLSLAVSIILWNGFLPKTGEASNSERKIESYLGKMFQNNRELLLQSPGKFVINYGKNYLALANIFTYDKNYVVSKDLSFIRGHENKAIGYRMYESFGEKNSFYMPDTYRERVEPFITEYNPPKYINDIQLNRLLITNLLFSLLYVMLPLALVVLLIYKVKYYRNSVFLNISILCTGSALFNIIEHSFIHIPIDRYIFWGYPLLLIFVSTLVVNLIQTLRPYPKFKMWLKKETNPDRTVFAKTGSRRENVS